MSATLELLLVFLLVLALVTKPIGLWMTPLAEGRAPGPIARVDALLLKCLNIRPEQESGWVGYTLALLAFNMVGFVLLYAILRLQGVLPWNPLGFSGMTPDQALNTAVSFVTNTNWQSYSGESTLSPLSQSAGLAVQNFLSAATGICVAFALMRGFVRHSTRRIGNFWADVVRVNLWLLLPISFVFALVLIEQGSVQSFAASVNYVSPTGVEGTIPLGPVASQEAIKILGTNGGGIFNVNSSHPFENPTAVTNFLQCLAIFAISAGLCWTFGRMAGSLKTGWTIWAAMAVLFVGAFISLAWFEASGADFLTSAGSAASPMHLEGKEMRFPLSHSVLFSVVTTAASCGAVNNMHDSLTPLGGMVPTLLMLLGEVVFGGVGAGFYGMVIFLIIAVFVAGLMVGRTPEYLGKKLDAPVMKLASIAMLVTPAIVLVGVAASVLTTTGVSSITNPGPHGLSQVVYAWASAANNNGSAFAGLGSNTPWYNIGLGAAMWFGRFLIIIAMLGVAGLLGASRKTPASAGTLPTSGPLFCGLLVGTVVLVGALTYLPLMALGPIAEAVLLP